MMIYVLDAVIAFTQSPANFARSSMFSNDNNAQTRLGRDSLNRNEIIRWELISDAFTFRLSVSRSSIVLSLKDDTLSFLFSKYLFYILLLSHSEDYWKRR